MSQGNTSLNGGHRWADHRWERWINELGRLIEGANRTGGKKALTAVAIRIVSVVDDPSAVHRRELAAHTGDEEKAGDLKADCELANQVVKALLDEHTLTEKVKKLLPHLAWRRLYLFTSTRYWRRWLDWVMREFF